MRQIPKYAYTHEMLLAITLWNLIVVGGISKSEDESEDFDSARGPAHPLLDDWILAMIRAGMELLPLRLSAIGRLLSCLSTPFYSLPFPRELCDPLDDVDATRLSRAMYGSRIAHVSSLLLPDASN